LEPLVSKLAELSAADRHEVVAAAEDAAAARPVLSWESWDAARGVVSFGGDAVQDSDRLYDGT
jgi:hypothetical protein